MITSRNRSKSKDECVVVPNGVAGPQSDPLGNGSVLLLRLSELDLGAERLVGL